MSLFHAALQQALDSDGNPIASATWNFYDTGTLTARNVYSTAALSVSLGSTVTANSAGRFANIFLNDIYTYRAILKDASGTTIKDIDPVNGDSAIDGLLQLEVGTTTLQSIDTNLNGSAIAADIGPLYLGHNTTSADGLTIDSASAFPPGVAFRRANGSMASPTTVTAGQQLGYIDFRGYNTGQMFNCASIDVKVDSGITFTTGEPPRTTMHFYITSTNDQANEAMRLVPYSGTAGYGGYFGFLELDGETTNPPRNFGEPRLFAATRLNGWAAIFDGRPATGLSYGLRIDLNGETASDKALSVTTGTGTGTEKAYWGGDGNIYIGGNKVLGSQGAAIADITAVATTGTLPTADGSITIADATTPTVVELLEYCRELEAKVEALLAAARTHGLIAT